MEDETPVKKPRKPDKRSTQEREPFQGFRKPESAFFRLPNEWTDITAEITSLAELKIIEYVARHTWGFQDFENYITLTVDEFMLGRKRNDETRMDRGTGLSESAAKLGIASAIEHKYIECEVDASDKGRIGKSYRLKMVPSIDEVEGHNLTLEDQKVTSQGQKLTARGIETNPRTDKETFKDTYQRNLEKEDDTSLDITPEMERVNTFWCVSKHHRGSKSITAKHIQEYRDVAPKVHTQEEFDDLCEFALKDLPPNNDGKLWMSNLANSVDNWLRSKEQQTPERQEDDIYYQGMEIPATTERAIERACKQKWGTCLTHSVINEAFKRMETPPMSFETLFSEKMKKADSPDDVLARMKRWVTTGTR